MKLSASSVKIKPSATHGDRIINFIIMMENLARPAVIAGATLVGVLSLVQIKRRLDSK